MAHEGYTTHTLKWQGRNIEVSYQANWLNTDHWHLELRCQEPLPATTTGYRSAFLAADAIETANDILPFVITWLDHAAEDPAWLRQVEDALQFRLF